MKTAIYARYSSSNQSEMSIEDQISVCRAKVQQYGWSVEYIFSDSAVSGSVPLAYRQGSAALLKAAESSLFDVLVLEGLDRLSRDQVEQEQVVRRLEYRGIRIVGVSDGYDSNLSSRKVLRSVRGLVNELYLDDLREKTHRGLTGQVNRGYSAGGKSYGYNLIKDEEGSRYEINEKEAKWVRYIFDEYSKGVSVQRIVHTLNKLAVPSPRNSSWAVSAIYGCPVKWSGILNNRLYIGKLVWNRSKWVKNPDTGQRKRVDRPQSEWLFKDIPELRIIDAMTWNKVRHRIDGDRDEHGRKKYKKAPHTLLGGLLRCPYCNGPIIAVNSRSYGCANNKDRGVAICRGLLVKRSIVENRLIEYIKTELLNDQALKTFEIEFKRVINEYMMNRGQTINVLKERLNKLNRSIEKIVESLTEIGHSDALLTKLRALEDEKSVVINHLSNTKDETLPDIRSVFTEVVNDLNSYLEMDKQKAHSILKGLFGKIQIVDNNGDIFMKIDNDEIIKLILTTQHVSKRGCEGRI